jgi:hypothetical protein
MSLPSWYSGGCDREHANLWGSLRLQCDCFIAVRPAEAGIATAEGVLQLLVQHRCSFVEEGLHRRSLVHTFGDDLVDRTLDERRRDWFAIPTPGGVMDQRSLVPLEVGQQIADVVFQAPDASQVMNRCTARAKAKRDCFPSEPIILPAITSKWRSSCRCRLRTLPPSSPTTMGSAGCAVVGSAVAVTCDCTTYSPTRNVLFRTVPEFGAPLIGSSSDSRSAPLPNGASAAYRAVT